MTAPGGAAGPTAAPAHDGAEERIAADLQARVGVPVGAIERFGDGHSGFTYRVELAESSCVLRLAPPGARSAGPADVGRQGAIMAALHRAGIPVPRVIDHDSGPAIDGRSFALMELVDGVGWEQAARAHSHLHVADRAVAALVALQHIDPRGVLEHEPAGSATTELERWAGLARRADQDGLGAQTEVLVAELAAGAPAPAAAPVPVHGDYHYGNLLFRDGEVVAILDWEIATVGQPYGDLAGLMVASLRARYEPEPNPTGTIDVPFARLCERHGAPLEAMRWWVAETCLKYSAILRYNRMLHRRARRVDPIYDRLDRTAAGLIGDGLAILERGFDAAPPGAR